MVMADESEFHVLAVDDSILDRKLIEKLLRTSSYQVTTVDSGSKALEFLGVHYDENTSPDSSPSVSSDSNHQVVEVNLVITDYCMPGMTGYDLLKKIKESSSLKNIPVVIMSSENVPSRISRCLEEGAEEFFLKPVRRSDLNRLKPHLMKTKFKDRKPDEVVEEQEERPKIESETQQQQQQRLWSDNNTMKRKSIDETLSPDRTRARSWKHKKKDPKIESETQQQQQQQLLLSNNNTMKRKSIDETLSPDRTRSRYADIANVV